MPSVLPPPPSAITDKVIPELKAVRQQRPLEKVYPFVWLTIHYIKSGSDGRYQNKAVYTVLALNLKAKAVLGLYLPESEGANSGYPYLSDLQNRGVEDILIACVDGLTGFPEAINSIYPQTECGAVVCDSPDTQLD